MGAVNPRPDAPLEGAGLASVIMNCYNSAEFLREALESVLAQTYESWEIIFWDNQSSDGSAEIFRAYPDPRFRYFRAPRHTKLGEARQLAVENANGEWLAFLDCDDTWTPDRLKRHMSVAIGDSDELGLIYSRAEIRFENSDEPRTFGLRRPPRSGVLLPDPRRYPRLPEGRILGDLAKDNFIPLVSATVRRRPFLAAGGFSGRYNQAEDYEMFFRVARVARARAVDEPLGVYRIHSSNLSHKQKALAVAETISLIEELPPGESRAEGLRIAQTDRAMYLILSGTWRGGMAVLFSKGSVRNLLARVVNRLRPA